MPLSRTSTAMRPAACAASTANGMPRSLQSPAISRIGCTTPISLFTHMTETTAVLSSRASARRARSSRPSPATGKRVTRKPSCSSRSTVSRTAGCSVATVTTWSCVSRRARATPFSIRLSLSVAPLVKTISLGRAPTRAATWARARSTASSARHPKAWFFEAAFPNSSEKYGSMASTTRGSHGVVAW